MNKEKVCYDSYQKLVGDFMNTDNREINYQNRIIIPLLEGILCSKDGISVIDVSTQYKNRESKVHTRIPYASKCTPDLLIARNWNYHNRENNSICYYAVIEIKVPMSNDRGQISQYPTNSISKVIWTNCLCWEFYDKEYKKKIDLYDVNNRQWKQADKWNQLCEYLVDFLGVHHFTTFLKKVAHRIYLVV